LAVQGWWKLDHAMPGLVGLRNFAPAGQKGYGLSSTAWIGVRSWTALRTPTARQMSNKVEVNTGRKTRSVAEQLKKLKRPEDGGEGFPESIEDSARAKADVSSGVPKTVKLQLITPNENSKRSFGQVCKARISH
jgi:hypothetical protein